MYYEKDAKNALCLPFMSHMERWNWACWAVTTQHYKLWCWPNSFHMNLFKYTQTWSKLDRRWCAVSVSAMHYSTFNTISWNCFPSIMHHTMKECLHTESARVSLTRSRHSFQYATPCVQVTCSQKLRKEHFNLKHSEHLMYKHPTGRGFRKDNFYKLHEQRQGFPMSWSPASYIVLRPGVLNSCDCSWQAPLFLLASTHQKTMLRYFYGNYTLRWQTQSS